MEKFNVTFVPENLSISVNKDQTILAAAISAGIYINSHCGGDGICGRCKVRVNRGQVKSQTNGIITPDERKNNVYLACLTTVHSDLEVSIPDSSRINFDKLNPEELQAKSQPAIFKHSPFIKKLYLELPPPTLNDSISDLERLYRSLRGLGEFPTITTGLFNIRQLSELLRDFSWKVTLTLGRRNNTVEIILIEPGDTSDKNFGFCFDIGTTTISGQLINLSTQEILGSKTAYNQQAIFGSDVITRIVYAAKTDGLEKLHKAVVVTINQIIKDLVCEYKIDLNNVYGIVCSGNTTMMHLLLSMDPEHIRRQPYIPTANFLPILPALEAGINIHSHGLLSCVPGVSSYVGGDTTAGILSSGIYQKEEPCILIDIGTNGEIVLGNRDFLVACAASAGPAFEGSGVTSGMRASSGAIQKVKINKNNLSIQCSTINGELPRGICGSGYIDLLSEMLDSGIIDKGGKIKITGKRIRETDNGREFVVCFKEEIHSQADIVITEADIDNLKRSKGAIYSACAILVKHLDLEFSAIDKIFIAGGFGMYLDIEKAIRIGLLPDLERDKFIFIGNSSLAGSREIILSSQAMALADALALKITYFDLSADSGYMEEYSQSLFFPHTDLAKFPTVRF